MWRCKKDNADIIVDGQYYRIDNLRDYNALCKKKAGRMRGLLFVNEQRTRERLDGRWSLPHYAHPEQDSQEKELARQTKFA